MRNTFVETSNVKRFLAALSGLEARGAEEACLIVVDGAPGVGKTTTLMHWVAQHGCIYLRAKKEWKARWFLNELLESMRIDPPNGFEKKFRRAVEELAIRRDMAAMERRPFGVVIDEADHIVRKPDVIETVRDFSDVIQLPIVLVGMGKINDNLVRYPQIAGRVSQKVRFEAATVKDVRALVDARCEIKVSSEARI